jgi:L-cysteine desulfidase
MTEEKFLAILKHELKAAVGSEAQASIALAAARTKQILNEPLVLMTVEISSSMYKNAFAVTVPGTSEAGIELAVAIGSVYNGPDRGLELLDNIGPADLKQAKTLLAEGRIQASVAGSAVDAIYIHIRATGEKNVAETWTERNYTNLWRGVLNGEIVREGTLPTNMKPRFEDDTALFSMELSDLTRIVDTFSEEELDFLLESVRMNEAMAEKGMEHRAGLGTGHGLKDLVDLKLIQEDITTQVRIAVASACDGRLGGLKQPVMSMMDSGNQGIMVSLPISIVAKNKKLPRERMLKALALGYLVTIYINQQIEWFPLICGTSISAGPGVAAAIAWMMGGSIEQIEGAARNAMASLAGVLCDGAKGGCALKLSSAASESVLAAFLALAGTVVNPDEGVVATSLKETIKKVSLICRFGKEDRDRTVLEILNATP